MRIFNLCIYKKMEIKIYLHFCHQFYGNPVTVFFILDGMQCSGYLFVFTCVRKHKLYILSLKKTATNTNI